jgi:hypothetical protein
MSRSCSWIFVPSILPSPLSNKSVTLLAVIAKQLEISPVLQGPRAIPCQEEKQGYSDIGYKVEWQQDDKLCDLTEREWRIY